MLFCIWFADFRIQEGFSHAMKDLKKNWIMRYRKLTNMNFCSSHLLFCIQDTQQFIKFIPSRQIRGRLLQTMHLTTRCQNKTKINSPPTWNGTKITYSRNGTWKLIFFHGSVCDSRFVSVVVRNWLVPYSTTVKIIKD